MTKPSILKRAMASARHCLAGVVLLVIAGCSPGTTRNSTPPTDPLVGAYCGSCHRPYAATRHTDEEWVEIMENHRTRVRLTDKQYKDILTYFTEHN